MGKAELIERARSAEGRALDALAFEHVMGAQVCDKQASAELPETCSLFCVEDHYAPDDDLIPAFTASLDAAATLEAEIDALFAEYAEMKEECR